MALSMSYTERADCISEQGFLQLTSDYQLVLKNADLTWKYTDTLKVKLDDFED